MLASAAFKSEQTYKAGLLFRPKAENTEETNGPTVVTESAVRQGEQ